MVRHFTHISSVSAVRVKDKTSCDLLVARQQLNLIRVMARCVCCLPHNSKTPRESGVFFLCKKMKKKLDA